MRRRCFDVLSRRAFGRRGRRIDVEEDLSGLKVFGRLHRHCGGRVCGHGRYHDIGATGRIRGAAGGPNLRFLRPFHPVSSGRREIEDNVVNRNVVDALSAKFLSEDLADLSVTDQCQRNSRRHRVTRG